VTNLFRILQTEFYQNRPSFVEDMTKPFWPTFYLDTVYINTHRWKDERNSGSMKFTFAIMNSRALLCQIRVTFSHTTVQTVLNRLVISHWHLLFIANTPVSNGILLLYCSSNK